MRRSRLAAAVIAGALVSVPVRAAGPPSERGAPAAGAWSAPASLSACASVGGAQVVFPSASPTVRTGPGAIVWSAGPPCPGGAGARVAVLGRGEVPGASLLPRTAAGAPIAPRGAIQAGGSPRGQIVIAGARPSAPSNLLLVQGGAPGPFAIMPEVSAASAPVSLARAYLGDVAIGSTPPGGSGLRVQRERFFAQSFAAPLIAAGVPVSNPTLALDFRTDMLAAWVHGSGLYARYLPTRGYPRAVQRLATVAPGTRPVALLSDDGRGMVAWSERRAARVSVHLDISGAGVSFGAPMLLERFTVPDSLPAAASPLLIRLRSESVMIAWNGASAGHWVLRSAPVELGGLGTVDTVAPASRDALLQALVPGPDGEALMLWSQSGGSGAASSLYASRGFQARPRRVDFAEAELVAPAGVITQPTVAIDPSGDDALAAWRDGRGEIEYSIRSRTAAPPYALAAGRSAREGADREG